MNLNAAFANLGGRRLVNGIVTIRPLALPPTGADTDGG